LFFFFPTLPLSYFYAFVFTKILLYPFLIVFAVREIVAARKKDMEVFDSHSISDPVSDKYQFILMDSTLASTKPYSCEFKNRIAKTLNWLCRPNVEKYEIILLPSTPPPPPAPAAPLPPHDFRYLKDPAPRLTNKNEEMEYAEVKRLLERNAFIFNITMPTKADGSPDHFVFGYDDCSFFSFISFFDSLSIPGFG